MKEFASGKPGEGAAGRSAPWLAWLLDTGGNKPLGERLPRWFLLFLLLFGAGMILISLVGDQGLIAYYGLRREARTLRADVEGLEQRRRLLQQEIEALRSDPEHIAYLAHKRLGLVRPDETVVQLPPAEEAP
jgi:cell division protein FtsB